MPNSQTPKTKRFIHMVKSLLDKGEVKNYKEIIDALEWNKTLFSSVINGRKNVPNDVYRKFIEIYQVEEEPLTSSPPVSGDIKDKYIALLEQRAKDIEVITAWFTAIEKDISEAKENQRAMYSFQMAFQDIALPILGSLGHKRNILREYGEKTVSYLEKSRKAGIEVEG